MITITGLGDPAVTAAVAAVLFGSFLLMSRALALHWMLAVASCGLVTGAIKLAIYAHGAPLAGIPLKSPSGHVAVSVLVYGALSLAAADLPRRAVPMGLAAVTVGLIAISRIYLDLHSEADVVAGLAIGTACLAWFAAGRRVALHGTTRLPRACVLAAVSTCVAGAAMGWRLRVDHALHVIAAYMTMSTPGAS